MNRGVYLLPSLITATSLFIGFLAIGRALAGDFGMAAGLVLVSLALDGLDGRIARGMGVASPFGAQFDSLTDAVVFGVAPALIAYIHLADRGFGGRALWLAAFFYVAAAVLRLARFNVTAGDKRLFRGLPTPAAAAFVVSLVWVGDGAALPPWIMPVALVACGGLMVSRFSYHSFKETHFRERTSFIAVVAIVALCALAALDLPRFMLAAASAYLLSGPALRAAQLVRRYRRDRAARDRP